MNAPIFILSPPRSFSSVVSTIIGQHPDLYCFPELHALYYDTVGSILDEKSNLGSAKYAPSGLLRAIAEIHENVQDSASCARAWRWLANHRHLTTKDLFDYMCQALAPKACIEKSPPNSINVERMLKLFRSYPNARYIHLTRSVVGSAISIKEFAESQEGRKSRQASKQLKGEKYALYWHKVHGHILKFRSIIPPSNYLMIKGEAILSDPWQVLPQLCRWLGVSDDKASIEAMLKPEESPYAFFGPRIAPCGNDPKFITNPVFRQMKKKPYSADSVHKFLESDGRSDFTEYYMKQAKDEKTLTELIQWNKSMLERIYDTQAQLGYA